MSDPEKRGQEPAIMGLVQLPINTSEDVSEEETTTKEAATKVMESVQDENAEHLSELQPHLHARTFLAVFAVCLIYFAQLFSIVGAGTQGETIAANFQATGDVVWITAPILILTAVLGPIVSQAADYWGRKWFLVILTLFGAVGGVVVARASSMAMIIVGFSIIGIAFGAQPLIHTVASEVLPRRWRPWGQASVMTANSLGLIIGIFVGGALNRHGNPNGFRNYFYIATAMFAIASAICVFTYRPLPTRLQTSYSFREKMAQLDWIGYGLLASSLVLFSVGLFWSQNPYKWSDPHPSATFAVGLALALLLIVYETKYKADGMFHHGLFKSNRNFTIAIIGVFCEGLAFMAVNVYFSFQVSVLYETDSFIVGVRFSIAFMASIVAAGFTGVYCAITKKVRWVAVVAFVICMAFFICMSTSNRNTSTPVWGYPVLFGWAIGMALIALVTVAQLSTPPGLISIGTGLIISVRSLGGTVGVAIYNAVYIAATQKMGENIGKAAAEAGLPANSVGQFVTNLLGQNSTGLAQVPGVTPAIISAGDNAQLDTYMSGFRNVWVTATAFVVVAAIASIFLFDPSNEFNNRIDAAVEKDEDVYSL